MVARWEGNEGVPPGSTIVELTLEADGDGTVLSLRHTGLPDGGRGDARGGLALLHGSVGRGGSGGGSAADALGASAGGMILRRLSVLVYEGDP